MQASGALAVIGCLALSTTAGAQAQRTDRSLIELCRAIKDDKTRLACFDHATAPAEVAAETTGAPSPDTWHFEESKSPVDDSPQLLAALVPAEGKSSFVVGCREHQMRVFLSSDAFLGLHDQLRVLYRINDQKAAEARWNVSTAGTAAFAPEPMVFLNSLPDDGTLFIRAWDYRGLPHDATFHLGAVSDVRSRAASMCAPRPAAAGQPKPKPAAPPAPPLKLN